MRLVEFEEKDHHKIAEFIVNNCQPYLAQNPELIPLYHGEHIYDREVVLRPISKNRSPLSSNSHLHGFMNEIIQKAGCTANRSNSLFCSGDLEQVDLYGRSFMVFPIGEFEITWSTKIDDAFIDIYNPYGYEDSKFFRLINTSDENSIEDNIEEQRTSFKYGDFENFDKNRIDDLVNSYKCDDLLSAINSKNEIMVKCEKVLLVNRQFYQEVFLKSLITNLIK